MQKFVELIKRLFCDHVYCNAVINPFIDQYGNHSAIYICEKCGKREFHTFYNN